MAHQYDFGFDIRPTLRLRYVEKILRESQVIHPIPARSTLIEMIEEGILEGKKVHVGWVVYKDSFDRYVRGFQDPVAA